MSVLTEEKRRLPNTYQMHSIFFLSIFLFKRARLYYICYEVRFNPDKSTDLDIQLMQLITAMKCKLMTSIIKYHKDNLT